MSAPRYIWLDALRLIAGVSMVGLHATADTSGQPFADALPQERIIPMLIRAVIYTARTELFLIISLFLLLIALDRRPRSYRQVVLEQARRLLVPFLFWTVFYAFWSLIKAHAFGYSAPLLEELKTPETWMSFLLLGSSKYHMHFLPTLFALVLFYPIFRVAVSHPLLGLSIFAGLLFKRQIDVYLWSNAQDWSGFDYLLRSVKILTYCGYGMVAGAFLGLFRKQFPAQLRNKQINLVFGAAALLFAVKLLHTAAIVKTGTWHYNFTPAFWADFLMPCLLFAACMLLADRTWPNWLSKAAPYSFGIYLCHPIFLDLAETLTIGLAISPTYFVLGKIGFAFASTTLLVIALSRIPSLAWTIGLGPLPNIGSVFLKSVPVSLHPTAITKEKPRA